MIIQLISFPWYEGNLSAQEENLRIKTICDFLNDTSADFVMFSEHVIGNINSLDIINKSVQDKGICSLFEINDRSRIGLARNRLFLLKDNNIINLQTRQVFSEAEDADEERVERLIEELEYHRHFEINKKKFLILQCGENNILKSIRGTHEAEFRLQNRPDLKKRFQNVIESADVVLNPVHTRWGRYGDFLCRIRTFSKKKRYCFSCSQIEEYQLERAKVNPAKNTTQIAMCSKKLVAPILSIDKNGCLIQSYDIR